MKVAHLRTHTFQTTTTRDEMNKLSSASTEEAMMLSLIMAIVELEASPSKETLIAAKEIAVDVYLKIRDNGDSELMETYRTLIFRIPRAAAGIPRSRNRSEEPS